MFFWMETWEDLLEIWFLLYHIVLAKSGDLLDLNLLKDANIIFASLLQIDW